LAKGRGGGPILEVNEFIKEIPKQEEEHCSSRRGTSLMLFRFRNHTF
jgi:hypothetical protein